MATYARKVTMCTALVISILVTTPLVASAQGKGEASSHATTTTALAVTTPSAQTISKMAAKALKHLSLAQWHAQRAAIQTAFEVAVHSAQAQMHLALATATSFSQRSAIRALCREAIAAASLSRELALTALGPAPHQ